MAGFASTSQSDFSKGAHPGHERVPNDGVENCINGLYDDDGTIFKRGGCTYLTTSDTSSTYGDLRSLWAGQLAHGESVVALSSNETAVAGSYAWAIWKLDDSTGVTLNREYDSTSALTGSPRWGRPVGALGLVFFPGRAHTHLDVYGGSELATVTYSSPDTVTTTINSTAVTGSGTSFLTEVDAGSILFANSGYGIVKSVESDTALTLTSEWYQPTTTGDATFAPWVKGAVPNQADVAVTKDTPAPVVGSAYDRLLIGHKNRLYFSSQTNPLQFATSEDYHELPNGVVITGIQQLYDTALLFTTDGVWALSGLAQDLTDDYGNAQHRLEKVNGDIVLWRDTGLGSSSDGIVVPAIDDVYSMTAGGAVSIGGGIRKLYREYVKADYIPGQAAVHRGHYFLPILDPSNDDEWVDLLVCNLASKGWTRWEGYAAKVRALTQRVRAGVPSLLATSGAGTLIPPDPPDPGETPDYRLINLTGCFEPGADNKQDADSSNFTLQVTFRTLGSSTLKAMWARFRVLYTLTDAASDNPTMTAEYSTGLPGSSFTALTGTATESADGMAYWPIRKRTKTIRIRLTSSGASSRCVIRGAETLYRQTGRK